MGAIRGEGGSQTPYDSKCMGPLVLGENCTTFFLEMELFQIFRTFLAMVSDAFCLWPFSHEDKMSAV